MIITTTTTGRKPHSTFFVFYAKFHTICVPWIQKRYMLSLQHGILQRGI